MSYQILNRFTVEQPELPVKILESRQEYRSCHIQLPDEIRRLPAIAMHGCYYSLFKVVSTQQQAVNTCARLAVRGDMTIITKTAKGHAIWVLEPDAQPAPPHRPTV
jgi:hypothetical protein